MIAVSKGEPLEPRHMERHVAGGGGEIAVVVAAPVALTLLAALVFGGLDIYTHITDDMQKQAADSIDRGIGKAAPTAKTKQAEAKPVMNDFKPYQGCKRKPWYRLRHAAQRPSV